MFLSRISVRFVPIKEESAGPPMGNRSVVRLRSILFGRGGESVEWPSAWREIRLRVSPALELPVLRDG